MEVDRRIAFADDVEETTVVVSGEIDFTNIDGLLHAATQLVDSGRIRVCFDLSQAAFLDSSGVRVLVTSRMSCIALGRELRIGPVSPQVLRVLQLGGLALLFDLPPLYVEPVEKPVVDIALGGIVRNISETVVLSEEDMVVPLRVMIAEAALEAGLSADALVDVKWATGEALANAFIHGSPRGRQSKIGVKCLSCPASFAIEVTDEGDSFGASLPQVSDDLESGENGIGLRMIYRAMDEVGLQRLDRGNCLRMVKWIR